MQYPDNETLTYGYGAHNQPTSLTTSLGGSYVTGATYDSALRPDVLTFGHNDLQLDLGYFAWNAANGLVSASGASWP